MVGSSVRGTAVVQDNVSDCSVVTALIVAAEHHARHRSKVRPLFRLSRSSLGSELTLPARSQLALSCLFPQDASGLPVVSWDGRYRARFLVNGTWRQVRRRSPF